MVLSRPIRILPRSFPRKGVKEKAKGSKLDPSCIWIGYGSCQSLPDLDPKDTCPIRIPSFLTRSEMKIDRIQSLFSSFYQYQTLKEQR